MDKKNIHFYWLNDFLDVYWCVHEDFVNVSHDAEYYTAHMHNYRTYNTFIYFVVFSDILRDFFHFLVAINLHYA